MSIYTIQSYTFTKFTYAWFHTSSFQTHHFPTQEHTKLQTTLSDEKIWSNYVLLILHVENNNICNAFVITCIMYTFNTMHLIAQERRNISLYP